MFKLVKDLTVWWPVSVLTPDEDNPGVLKEETFEAQLLIRSRDERKTYQQQRDALVEQLPKSDDYLKDFAAATAKAKEIGAEIDAYDRSMFHLIIQNWRGIVGDNDEAIAFSPAMLDMALDRDGVIVGINEAFQQAISSDKARLGNSKA